MQRYTIQYIPVYYQFIIQNWTTYLFTTITFYGIEKIQKLKPSHTNLKMCCFWMFVHLSHWPIILKWHKYSVNLWDFPMCFKDFINNVHMLLTTVVIYSIYNIMFYQTLNMQILVVGNAFSFLNLWSVCFFTSGKSTIYKWCYIKLVR